jgi:hypothetical protein
MNFITFPVNLLRDCLRRLSRSGDAFLRCPCGINRREGSLELIVAPLTAGLVRFIAVVLSESPIRRPEIPSGCIGALTVSRGTPRGQAAGVLRSKTGALEPIHELRLVGPGMHRLSLLYHVSNHDDQPESSNFNHPAWFEKWSRTIGALGEGTWHRIVMLHYAVVGVGRTGSYLASSLLSLGVRRLTLIDPDSLEFHNLGESVGLTRSDVGRSKATALAGRLSKAHNDTTIMAVPSSVTHLNALNAIRHCDFLFCCADHDSARHAVTTLGALFCKPVLDIGSGIHANEARRMGADVRLVLPGQCLLCFGGLQNEAEARSVLSSRDTERRFYAQRNWREERAGSLASLNHLAVSLALRLLEDFIGERVRESKWIRVEFDETGIPSISLPTVSRRSVCRHCALFTGLGQDGIPLVPSYLDAPLAE